MRLLAELAGDLPGMAAGELHAVLASNGTPLTRVQERTRLLDGQTGLDPRAAVRVGQRLGLVHRLAEHAYDGDPHAWDGDPRGTVFPLGATVAVRATRLDVEAPWRGPQVERELGARLGRGRRVDLQRPQVGVRAFLARDHIIVGRELWQNDPKAFARRHARYRPHSSPISLEPRIARAVVNLTQARPGQTVYDPCCGTGGLLIEAAVMGMRAVGSDLDAAMAEGTKENLRHLGLDGLTFVADVADAPLHLPGHAPEGIDAVACDLPYGRSATLGGTSRGRVYRNALDAAARLLPPGGRAVLGLPDIASTELAHPRLAREAVYPVRVHRSLTRHFVVLRRT